MHESESASSIAATRAYHQARSAERFASREQERTMWYERARVAVLEIAPGFPDIRRVYLFGSVLKPGRFRSDSDIDIAVVSDTVEAENAFWPALERALRRDIDVRPMAEPLSDIVLQTGELIYER